MVARKRRRTHEQINLNLKWDVERKFIQKVWNFFQLTTYLDSCGKLLWQRSLLTCCSEINYIDTTPCEDHHYFITALRSLCSQTRTVTSLSQNLNCCSNGKIDLQRSYKCNRHCSTLYQALAVNSTVTQTPQCFISKLAIVLFVNMQCRTLSIWNIWTYNHDTKPSEK